MPDGHHLHPRRSGQEHRQCGAIPVVGQGGSARVVLITSRGTGRWVIPKGWIEPGEQPHLSAARETFEEAGLAGEIESAPLGTYTYDKRLPRGAVLPQEVVVFLFRVERLLADWPERRERTRRLFVPDVAATLVQEPELAGLLRRLSRG
jgi:8-oxo-dGTP pyrophosphatase MutT (NUDIX family)